MFIISSYSLISASYSYLLVWLYENVITFLSHGNTVFCLLDSFASGKEY